ncbi:MAG: hypothetical protein IPI65_16330 [Bacteroidetes bacterium]|nr:hypothetical protein [Bacteroidota bacterium]
MYRPLRIAKLAKNNNARQYLIISAMGANAKSSIFYNRLKGELQDKLIAMQLPGLHIFEACPTGALDTPYQIDASKCISYLTIELKDTNIPEQFAGKMDNWIFGCDICQTVCPWNRFSTKHQEPKFNASAQLEEMEQQDWEEITAEVFNLLFKKSAVKRTKFTGLQRNIKFIEPYSEK